MGVINHLPEIYPVSFSEQLSVQRLALFNSPATVEETPGVLKKHALMIDNYFQSSFEASVIGPKMDFIKNPYAIVALGGYGRSEQCVHSDVDLLILFQKRVPSAADELIREIVYPLWDLKLEVGHATRSLEECVLMSRDDYEVLTSILDARFLCGNSSVFTKMQEQVKRRIVKRNVKKIINWLIERNSLRHEDFGDSTFLLQPNLKEGNGGLRDYHTMRWIAAIKYDLIQRRDLEYQGYMSYDEYNDLMSALSFIWAVRNKLHLLTKRKCDQLYFEYQKPVAESMGFKDINGQTAVESFLSELHFHTAFIKNQFQLFLYEIIYGQKRTWKKRARKINQSIKKMPGIHILKSRLDFNSPEMIVKNPELLIKIFEVSARLKIPLSREASRLVHEFGYLVDDPFRASLSVKDSFEQILLSPAPMFNVLEQMLNTGFLIRLIPEYGNIADRIQYDVYHLYPVDRHMLKTVYTLKMFEDPESGCHDELYAQLYRGLKRKKILLLAALLHDIGKGQGGRHSAKGAKISALVMKRMGYTSREIDTVSFLIENHLLLIKIATRRDINDEETALNCARKIRDAGRLKMLYLLTVADSYATGPKAWNSWTASLLRDFFLKVSGILETGELATASAMNRVEKKKRLVLEAGEKFEGMDLESLFDEMSPRYVLYTEVEDIISHLKLYERLGDEPFVWEVRKDKETNTRTIVICAKDRPGLISEIAGTFTLNGINVFDVQVYTWKNDIALDIFKVEPPPEQIFEAERWDRAEKNLKAVLLDELDLSVNLIKKFPIDREGKGHVSNRPNRVVVDNKSSSFFTIIEIFAYDFPGLLFKVTDAIRQCGLSIRVAKIATKIDQVVDVFYVRDETDEKVDDPKAVESIKAAILSVLSSNQDK